MVLLDLFLVHAVVRVPRPFVVVRGGGLVGTLPLLSVLLLASLRLRFLLLLLLLVRRVVLRLILLLGIIIVRGARLEVHALFALHGGALLVLVLLLRLVLAALALLLVVLGVPHLLVHHLGVLVVLAVAHLLIDRLLVALLVALIVLLVLLVVRERVRVRLEIVLHLDPAALILRPVPPVVVLLVLLPVLRAENLFLVLDLVAHVLLPLALAHPGAGDVVHHPPVPLAPVLLALGGRRRRRAEPLRAHADEERREHRLELRRRAVELDVLDERRSRRRAKQTERRGELARASARRANDENEAALSPRGRGRKIVERGDGVGHLRERLRRGRDGGGDAAKPRRA